MRRHTIETSDSDPRGLRTLGRDVAAIVLTGIVLGVAFNAVSLSSRPPRGLPWIPVAQQLDDVDSLLRLTERPVVGKAPASPRGAADAPTRIGRPAGDASAKPLAVATNETPSPERTGPVVHETATNQIATDRAAREPLSRPVLAVIPDVDRALRVELPLVILLVEAGAALVVDARDAQEFSAGHIPGAVNIPYDQAMADPARVEKLDAGGRPIIVYCSGGTCESSRYLAELLMREFKKKRVLVYERGFPEWVAAGKPVVKGNE